jgi:hypothetical protein
MRIVGAFRAFRLTGWIDSQDDLRHLLPGRAFFCGVQQPQIYDRMGAVIVDDLVVIRRDVGDGTRIGVRHDLRIQKRWMFDCGHFANFSRQGLARNWGANTYYSG